jgi:hypothetical protein
MIIAFSRISWVGCALCMLMAVVVGAFRHWCMYLWKRTGILRIAAGKDNKAEELRLGPYVPTWKSRKVQLGSWLSVAACSILGAALGTVPPQGFDIGHFSNYFLGILLTRWLLSALLGRGVANYTLRRSKGLRMDRADVCDEALEFCGVTRGANRMPR